VTGADGIVQFTTIYPGWYQGRTVHIHCKVHLNNTDVLTSQFYFDEDVTSTVYEGEPYASETGRDAFNDDDPLFLAPTLLTLTSTAEGYQGLINVGVDRR
jgi:protocatechuate 3,4-dioxygenase beta subunit